MSYFEISKSSLTMINKVLFTVWGHDAICKELCAWRGTHASATSEDKRMNHSEINKAFFTLVVLGLVGFVYWAAFHIEPTLLSL